MARATSHATAPSFTFGLFHLQQAPHTAYNTLYCHITCLVTQNIYVYIYKYYYDTHQKNPQATSIENIHGDKQGQVINRSNCSISNYQTLSTFMLYLLRNIVEQLSDQLRGVRNAHNSGQGSIEEERYHQMQSECQLLQGTCMSLFVCMCVCMRMQDTVTLLDFIR